MTAASFMAVAALVADPTRLRMLFHLDHGPRTVGQLAAGSGITPSSAGYHVRRMEEAGLVGVQHVGRRAFVRRIERRWATILRALATAE
jgi:DNA-binding transcriptional ArsR family regulator